MKRLGRVVQSSIINNFVGPFGLSFRCSLRNCKNVVARSM